MPTTIQVSQKLKRRLSKHKQSPRQTYEEVIEKALDLLEEDELELRDDLQAQLRRARRDVAAGKFVTTKQLLKELGL